MQSTKRTWLSRMRAPEAIDNAGSLALLAVYGAMLLFYIFVTYRAHMHSDAAVKLMLGEQMAQQLTLLPRDWDYVNDIWIIFPNLIAAPFLLFFQPSMLLHSVVSAIAATLLLLSVWLAARAAGIRGALRWLPVTLIACCPSGEFTEVVFGQSAYSIPLLIIFLLAGSAARYVANAGHASVHSRRDLTIIAVLLAIAIASGPRGLASNAAPLLLACGMLHLLSAHDPRLRAAVRRLFATSLITTFGASLVLLFLVHWLRFHAGAIAQGFSTREMIANHLQLIVENWFELFDALPPGGERFSPFIAAMYAARFAIATWLFLLPLALLVRVVRLKSTPLAFLVLLHAAILASTTYLLVFTGVFVDEKRGAARYLLPILPTALLIAGLWLQETAQTLRFNAARYGWVIVLLMLWSAPQRLVGAAFVDWSHPQAGLRRNSRADLVETLKAAGLRRGFATYWNASVVSVLSGGDVRVAAVNMSGGLPVPYHHLTSGTWYSRDWTGAPSFLVVGADETAQLNRPALRSILGEPQRTLRAGTYEVLVYPFDVAEKLGYTAQQFTRAPLMTPETCAAEFSALEPQISLGASAPGLMRIHGVNRSAMSWSQNSIPNFTPGLRILDAQGNIVASSRGLLPGTVPPGGAGEIAMPFRAPDKPGEYKLEFSFLAEGDAWCGNVNHSWTVASLSVQP